MATKKKSKFHAHGAVWEFGGPDDSIWVYVRQCSDGYKPWSGGCGIGVPLRSLEAAIVHCLQFAQQRLGEERTRLAHQMNAIADCEQRIMRTKLP